MEAWHLRDDCPQEMVMDTQPGTQLGNRVTDSSKVPVSILTRTLWSLGLSTGKSYCCFPIVHQVLLQVLRGSRTLQFTFSRNAVWQEGLLPLTTGNQV